MILVGLMFAQVALYLIVLYLAFPGMFNSSPA